MTTKQARIEREAQAAVAEADRLIRLVKRSGKKPAKKKTREVESPLFRGMKMQVRS